MNHLQHYIIPNLRRYGIKFVELVGLKNRRV